MLSRLSLLSVSSCDPNSDNLWRSFGSAALRVRVLQPEAEPFSLLLSYTLALMVTRLKGVGRFQNDDNALTYMYVPPVICHPNMSKVYRARTGVLHFHTNCTQSWLSVLEHCRLFRLAVQSCEFWLVAKVYLFAANLLNVARAAVFNTIQLFTVKRAVSRRIDPGGGDSTPLNIYLSTHRDIPDFLNLHPESSFFSLHSQDPICVLWC
jgi:hypothetical protein